MDPFLSPVSKLKRSGIPSLILLSGVILGAALYQQYLAIAPMRSVREITPPSPLTQEEKTNIQIFEESAPSVVYITAKRKQWFLYSSRPKETTSGTGSGFIWDNKGHIVTNYHVLQARATHEVVLYDQSVYEAKLVGIYPDKDLAVLKIDAPADKLAPIKVGSNQGLKVGQKVLAIGNPFGLDHTLTTGVVSALDRMLDADARGYNKIQGVIQTDAAINPGNSGGPLLDSGGRLIGVNTQIYSTSGSSAGIGFAIPVDTVNDVVPQLIESGRVKVPGLGIIPESKNERVMRYLRMEGLLINNVQSGGAAERAGLRGVRWRRDGTPVLGDIITAIDGKPITSTADLRLVLDDYKVGDEVEISYFRDGKSYKTKLNLQTIR